MPLKYFLCPDDEKVEIESCLKGCRLGERCAPLGYLEFVGKERVLGLPSVTELIKGTREVFLQRTTEYAIRPEDNAFAVVGTIGHRGVQGNAIRFEYSGITGEPDELYENGLVDYKVVGSYKVMRALGMDKERVETGEYYKNGKPKQETRFVFTGDKDIRDYILQNNMYAIMAGEAGHRIEWMKNYLIVRDAGLAIAAQRGITRKCYYIDIPFMQRDECLSFFAHKKKNLEDSLDQNIVPGLCTEEECWGGNKCRGYCSVSEFCINNPHLKGE